MSDVAYIIFVSLHFLFILLMVLLPALLMIFAAIRMLKIFRVSIILIVMGTLILSMEIFFPFFVWLVYVVGIIESSEITFSLEPQINYILRYFAFLLIGFGFLRLSYKIQGYLKIMR